MPQFEIYDTMLGPGQYEATFEGIQEIDSQWGTRLQWIFKVRSGPSIGLLTSAFSGADRPSIRSNLGKFLASLEGESPKAGTIRDPGDYVGRVYQITVSEGEQEGSTKVTSFKPVGGNAEAVVGKGTAAIEVPF